ncbi:hypothetical protein Q8A73_010154 [Channa argus]|nr:hypothetical protein Q8A73_010154 [Channa argus]
MDTSSGEAGIPSMEAPVTVTCEGVGELPSMGATITEEAPSLTSLGYSDRPHWVSGPGQELLLSGSLATGCLVRLVDKDPDNADIAVVEQPTVETEQGKQVLVAKCAFSEQRNDSYVLASVVAGTVSGADRNSLLLL